MTLPHITTRHRWAVKAAAAAAVLTVTTLPLAACSTYGGSKGGGEKTGTTTISLSMQNPNVKTADPATYAIVQAFEKKNPGVKVDLSGQAVAEHLQNLSVAAQSNTLPDIFWVYNSTAQQMESNGNLLDLTPVLQEMKLTDKFSSSTLANFSTGGKTYGVPYQGLLTGLWINKKILADNGLTQPKTFDDLLAVSKALHAKGITTISNGANQSSFSVWSFLVDLDRFGYETKIDSILSGKSSYVNSDFLRLYQHIDELRKAGAFSKNVSTQTYQQAVNAFTSGKAAMLDAGVWASSAIQSSSVGTDATFWAGPTFSDGVGKQDIVMNVASAPFAVSAKVKDDPAKLAAVKKFLAFYYGDQAQQTLVDNGQPPVTTYQAKVDPTKQSALKSALDAATAPGVTSPKTQPDLVVKTPVANAMYDSIYGVIQGQLTPKAALQLVQKALDDNK